MKMIKLLNTVITDRALCLGGPGMAKRGRKSKRKTMKNVGLDNTNFATQGRKLWVFIFFTLYIKTKAYCCRSPTHCFLDKERYQLLLVLLLISTLQRSIREWWGNRKTEHVQANIPTLPSGGGLPLGLFALILEVRLLGAFWGHLSMMAAKKEVTANTLQWYLFVGTSPLSHDLAFRHFLSTSPLACCLPGDRIMSSSFGVHSAHCDAQCLLNLCQMYEEREALLK